MPPRVELGYVLQNHMQSATLEKRSRRVGGGYDRIDHGRRRSRQEHAGRLPRFHHQRARQGGIPDIELHLDADSFGDPERRQAEGHRRVPQLDG